MNSVSLLRSWYLQRRQKARRRQQAAEQEPLAPAPTIGMVYPLGGDELTPGAHDSVSIYGSGFQEGAIVTIGGAVMTIIALSSEAIHGTAPLLAPGQSYDLTVTNPDAQSVTVEDAVAYAAFTLAACVHYSLTTGRAEGITLAGTGLAVGTTLTVGGAAVTITGTTATWYDAHIVIESVPAHAVGNVDIVATHPVSGTATLSGAMHYINPFAGPTIAVRGSETVLTVRVSAVPAGATCNGIQTRMKTSSGGAWSFFGSVGFNGFNVPYIDPVDVSANFFVSTRFLDSVTNTWSDWCAEAEVNISEAASFTGLTGEGWGYVPDEMYFKVTAYPSVGTFERVKMRADYTDTDAQFRQDEFRDGDAPAVNEELMVENLSWTPTGDLEVYFNMLDSELGKWTGWTWSSVAIISP